MRLAPHFGCRNKETPNMPAVPKRDMNSPEKVVTGASTRLRSWLSFLGGSGPHPEVKALG